MSRKQRHELGSVRTTDDLTARLDATGVDLAEVVGRYLVDPQDAAVLVVGSIAEGTANESSDVDVMVLLDGKARLVLPDATLPITAGRGIEVMHYEGGLEFNLEFFERARWDGVVQAFLEVAPAMYDPRDVKSLPLMEFFELRFLHRLRTGWPVTNAALAERWRDEFMVDFLPIYLTVRHYVECLEYQEDLRAMVDGPPGAAHLVGRICLEYALLSLLASRGFTGQSRKWLLHWCDQLEDPSARELANDAVALLLEGADPDGVERFCAGVDAVVTGVEAQIRAGDAAVDKGTDFLLHEIDYVVAGA